MTRRLGALAAAALCALTLVWGTTAEPASADFVQSAQELIPAVSGTSVATGGAVTACVASGVCEAVGVIGGAAAVATAVGYYGFHYLHWGWGSGHAVEHSTMELDQTLSPDATTTYGGGCWSAGTEAGDCDSANDGYSGDYSGVTLQATMLEVPQLGQDGEVKVRLSRSSTSGPSFRIWLYCGNYGPGGFSGGSPLLSTATLTGTALDATITMAAGSCTGLTTTSSVPLSVGVGVWPDWALDYYHPPVDVPGFMVEVPAPQHKWATTKVCHGASGNTTVTGLSAAFQEADSPLPAFPNPACPSGSLATSYEVKEGNATGVGGSTVLTWTAPAAWTDGSAPQYSDCLPGGSAAPCTLSLLKYSPSGLLECTGGAVDCTGFDPSTSSDTEYQCRWGTHLVGLTQCANAPRVEPTHTDAGAETQPVDPEAPFSPDPRQSVVECVGGIGWNPINWVVRPVVCALKYAFVPSTSIGTYTAPARAAFDGSFLGSMTDVAGSLFTAVTTIGGAADSGDCHGPALSLSLVPGGSPTVMHPLEACTGGAHTLAQIVHGVLTFVIAGTGAMALINLLSLVWGGPRLNTESSDDNGQGRFVL